MPMISSPISIRRLTAPLCPAGDLTGHPRSRPDRALFPALEDRQIIEDGLTRTLIAALRELPEGSVVPDFDHAAFAAELTGFDFAEPRRLAELLDWTVRQMRHGIVHVNHPRYFGLFNPAPAYPAECADRIVAAFNPQLATWTTSPAAVRIEAHVIEAVGRRAGFMCEAVGNFTSGGSEANYTALLCALTRCQPGFADTGARAFTGQPVFYVSRDCHLAWVKIGHQAGVGRSSVRFVDTDGVGRMDVAALAPMIAADRAAGNVPVMIVATAGTTNAGMIDPIAPCADLAEAAGLWLHVDAAWGGALMASEKQRHLLAGIERADSITIDAHKWFSTTMGCGMFLTPHSQSLSAAFQVKAGFMPSNMGGIDPFLSTPQWSRRFLGLRLFLALAATGWAGYGRLVDTAADLANQLKDGLAARGWTIANDLMTAVVCAEPPKGFPEPKVLVDRIVKSGSAWCSVATFEKRDVVRAAISNGTSTGDDVDALIRELEGAYCPEAAACAAT
jgi:glutamate/tyrosine decarboxylase-like PLP-dependent enzyme